MRDRQQDGRKDDVEQGMRPEIAQRIPVPFEPDIDPVEIAPEPVQLGNDILDLEKRRPHDAQIARAVLARNGFVLDRLGTERALHRQRDFLRRMMASTSSLARASSSRSWSRLRRRLSRSAISVAGTATSRAQDAQTSALSAFSAWQ
ncbi:hypothetical protein [Bradyrhizobium diazoefficiens]|uniref:hypothetical protein n=1 Tax=Bradyrhizobium diazoefficiens TaxID=1355477 RepID=UPI001FEE8B80|nr:hypothetical protein [Bradyrhizobium diazoefficiens]